MRCKTVWRQFAEVEGKMCDLKNYILKAPNNCIRTLTYIIKGVIITDVRDIRLSFICCKFDEIPIHS